VKDFFCFDPVLSRELPITSLLAHTQPSFYVYRHSLLLRVVVIPLRYCFGSHADNIPQIQPNNIEVTSIADKVSNGEIWVLGGSLA
jgi:hypothetical protein